VIYLEEPLKLKELREKKCWTVAQLTKASGVSKETIRLLENGQKGANELSLTTLNALCGAFDLDVYIRIDE